ncbi:MAG TPA: hypothetical protein VGG74_14800 [Kofleriaceae bacterium]|jgi:hypothetical protein
MLSLIPSTSVEAAVGSSSTVIGLTMDTPTAIGVSRYVFLSSVPCWISQGTSGKCSLTGASS